MQRVDDIHTASEDRSSPHQLIPKEALGCHLLREFDNWVAESFYLNPLFPHNDVDAKRCANKDDDKPRP